MCELKFYSLNEVAQILGVTHRTVWNYVKNGKIPAKMIGGKWKISEKDLIKYIDNANDNMRMEKAKNDENGRI